MNRLLSIIMLVLATATVRADHLDDVREWPDNKLPIASNWNCGGFTFDWHVDQIRAGNWFLPTTKIGLLPKNPAVGSGQKLTPENEAFLRDGGFPLTLRSENIANIFTSVLPRLPAAESANSPIVWKVDAGGNLEDVPIADILGPLAPWRSSGEAWGKSAVVADLQRRFPKAARILLADNNESGVDKPTQYLAGKANPDYYPDKIYSWKSPHELAGLNVRVRDYANSGKTPIEFLRAFEFLRSEKYNALKAGMDSSFDAWQGRLLLESYDVPAFRNDWHVSISPQFSPQFGHVDGGGGTLYVPKESLGDFTSPEWFRVYLANPVHARAEALSPKHFRQLFVNLSGGGIIAGYQAGRHELITRERYAAHLQWLLWSSKGIRTPLNLRYWIGNAKTPETPLFASDAAKALVTAAGYPELAAATEEMPIRAAMEAVNRINGDPILRRFWLEGEPVSTGTHPENELRYFHYNKVRVYPQADEPDDGFRLLECDRNAPREAWIKAPTTNTRGGWNPIQIKVWGTATRIGQECLVHLWSPCQLEGKCRVTVPDFGTFDVDVPQPGGYWVIEKPAPIQPPPTIRKLPN